MRKLKFINWLFIPCCCFLFIENGIAQGPQVASCTLFPYSKCQGASVSAGSIEYGQCWDTASMGDYQSFQWGSKKCKTLKSSAKVLSNPNKSAPINRK
ncbi:MAG: hypothetical protein HYX35_06915 [Proteobacteria bacterium]|nr:hypothetical protein [Pseudomonadota bacterium]